jgi:hypothetical protein
MPTPPDPRVDAAGSTVTRGRSPQPPVADRARFPDCPSALRVPTGRLKFLSVIRYIGACLSDIPRPIRDIDSSQFRIEHLRDPLRAPGLALFRRISRNERPESDNDGPGVLFPRFEIHIHRRMAHFSTDESEISRGLVRLLAVACDILGRPLLSTRQSFALDRPSTGAGASPCEDTGAPSLAPRVANRGQDAVISCFCRGFRDFRSALCRHRTPLHPPTHRPAGVPARIPCVSASEHRPTHVEQSMHARQVRMHASHQHVPGP